jgi:hypothetical protein
VPHDLSAQSTVDGLEPVWLRQLASLPLEAAELWQPGGGAAVPPPGAVDADDADDDDDANEDAVEPPQAAIDGDTRILSYMFVCNHMPVQDAE